MFKMPTVNAELGDLILTDVIISFNHMKRLYEKEETNVIKVTHALKENALHPSNIQKISPKLTLCKLLYAYHYFHKLSISFFHISL